MENSENKPDLKQYFKENVLGKYVRVILSDDRKIYGNLHCVDKFKNMVLVDSVQEIDDKYVAPINQTLKFYVKNQLKPENYLKIPQEIANNEEQKKQLEKEFRRNKFYIGQVIIPGKNVKKLEIQV